MLIIAAGIALRITVFLQNRSLILDEANVIRNIYERGYLALLKPLNYEQFAPPFFLWATKTSSHLLGFGEMAMRAYPLICSIISLWLLWRVLRTIVTNTVAISYSLLLMASGMIYIRYATEVKQYSGDVMIALALLLLSLKVNIASKRPLQFLLIWAFAGSLAIWCSMPSVFVLAGIFAGYAYTSITRNRHMVPALAGASLVWASQFLLYFFVILKPEIGSGYLQTSHQPFFIQLCPFTLQQWLHNLQLILDIVGNMGGNTALAIAFHMLLMVIGTYRLMRVQVAQLLVLVIPVLCLLAAAAAHQFTLMPRVVMFIMPALLLLTAIGFAQLLAAKQRAIQYVAVAIAVVCIVNFNRFDFFVRRYKNEEFKEALAIVQQAHIPGNHLHINYLVVPLYKYYTAIHPGHAEWADLYGADETSWRTNYDSLARTFTNDAIIYEAYAPDQLIAEMAANHAHCTSVSEVQFPGGTVVIVRK